MTFRQYDSLPDPAVVANATQAEVVDGSAQETVLDAGNATSDRRHEVSFLLDIDDGTAVVGVGDPTAVSPAKSRSPSVASGTLQNTQRVNNQTWLTIDADGLTTVTVEYTGYSAGDATLDGSVDATDAATAATAAVDSSSANGYGDIDGDGDVTAVDAMFIQQYADGNRTADFSPTGGGN